MKAAGERLAAGEPHVVVVVTGTGLRQAFDKCCRGLPAGRHLFVPESEAVCGEGTRWTGKPKGEVIEILEGRLATRTRERNEARDALVRLTSDEAAMRIAAAAKRQVGMEFGSTSSEVDYWNTGPYAQLFDAVKMAILNELENGG